MGFSISWIFLEQSNRMLSNIGMHKKQRCKTEFLHAEEFAHIDIRWCLLNIDGNQSGDVSTLKQWVVYLSSGNSNMKEEPCFAWTHTDVTLWNEDSLDQL